MMMENIHVGSRARLIKFYVGIDFFGKFKTKLKVLRIKFKIFFDKITMLTRSWLSCHFFITSPSLTTYSSLSSIHLHPLLFFSLQMFIVLLNWVAFVGGENVGNKSELLIDSRVKKTNRIVALPFCQSIH